MLVKNVQVNLKMELDMAKKELQDVILWLESMNSGEMDAILSVIIDRYALLYPESELIYLFLPKNDMEERKQILQQVVKFLLKHSSDDKN